MSEATLRAELGFVDSIWPKIKEAIDGSIFALDTSSSGVEGALKVAADIALTKWREAQAVSLPDRTKIAQAIAEATMDWDDWGHEPGRLAWKAADAVLAALSTQPAAGEVLTVVEWGEALITDDEPETYELRKGPWSGAQPVDEGYALVRRVAQYTPWTEVQP